MPISRGGAAMELNPTGSQMLSGEYTTPENDQYGVCEYVSLQGGGIEFSHAKSGTKLNVSGRQESIKINQQLVFPWCHHLWFAAQHHQHHHIYSHRLNSLYLRKHTGLQMMQAEVHETCISSFGFVYSTQRVAGILGTTGDSSDAVWKRVLSLQRSMY